MSNNFLASEAQVAINSSRIDRLALDISELRKEAVEVRSLSSSLETRSESRREREIMADKTNARIDKLEAKLDEKLEPLVAAFNKSAGGHLVIVGLAGILTYLLGFWDKFVKVFH